MAALAVPVLLAAAATLDPRLQPLLERVSEEVNVFAGKCHKFLGVEILTQKGRAAPPRFQLHGGARKAEAPQVSYRSTTVVSEYAFGQVPGGADQIREVRVVTAVNGRGVRERGKARLALAEGMNSDSDRLNAQMLLDFESYGLVGAVTDMGQMLLLFNRASLPDFEFEVKPDAVHDGESVAVIAYKRRRGPAANIYHRGTSRSLMQGELWVSRASGLPMRITADLPVTETGKKKVIHSMAVDYRPAAQGVLMPTRASYVRRQDDIVYVETEALYSDFRMFSAEAEIKFLAEEPVAEPQPAPPVKP